MAGGNFRWVIPVKTKVLRVEAPHFVSGAVWSFDWRTGWRCIEAALILSWMVGMSPAKVRSYLESRRWKWSWLDYAGSVPS